MIEISRSYDIQAAHRLPGVPNTHKCFGMHGHSWRIRVVVTGPIHPVTGMIVDFADMDELFKRLVHAKLDHRVLNESIANPTTEHMVGWVYSRLAEPIAKLGGTVIRIEIEEGSRSGAVLRVSVPQPPNAQKVP